MRAQSARERKLVGLGTSALAFVGIGLLFLPWAQAEPGALISFPYWSFPMTLGTGEGGFKSLVTSEDWNLTFPRPLSQTLLESSQGEPALWEPGAVPVVTFCRFIKRKKFDDELVESSLAKSSTRVKGAGSVESGRCSGSEPSSSEKKKVRYWAAG